MRQIRRNIARNKGIPWSKVLKLGPETTQSRVTKSLVLKEFRQLMKEKLGKK